MKKSGVVSFVLFFLAGLSALAETGADRILISQLTPKFIDIAVHAELQGGSSFRVLVNETRETVTLHYLRPYTCKEGHACPAVMLNETVGVPLVDVFTNKCGSRFFEAMEDLRPADGNLTKITVIDNTDNRCPHFVALPETEVIYETTTSGFSPEGPISGRSTFTGTALALYQTR